MQATVNQLRDALNIHKKLGVALPKKMTADAYGRWLANYKTTYVKEQSISDLRDLLKVI